MNFLIPKNRQQNRFTIIAGNDDEILNNYMFEEVLKESNPMDKTCSGYSTSMQNKRAPHVIQELLNSDYELGNVIFMAYRINQKTTKSTFKEYFKIPENYNLEIVLISEDDELINDFKSNAGYDSLTVIHKDTWP